MKITTERRDGVATLIVSGEVDAAEKAQVGEAVRAALAQGDTRLVFDFRDVTFMGSTGVGCLLSAQKDAAARSGGVAVVNPPKTLQKMFRTLGLEHAFPIFPSREEAQKSLGKPA
jgi:anti-sigma B factor antagonist